MLVVDDLDKIPQKVLTDSGLTNHESLFLDNAGTLRAISDQALLIYREIGHRRGEAIALAGQATALAANGTPSAPLVPEEAVRRTAEAGLKEQSKELQRLLDETAASAEQIET